MWQLFIYLLYLILCFLVAIILVDLHVIFSFRFLPRRNQSPFYKAIIPLISQFKLKKNMQN